jgi:hypothetical protein
LIKLLILLLVCPTLVVGQKVCETVSIGNGASNSTVPGQNVARFFSGSDLSGWQGEQSVWRVERGEIVGRSSTRRELLRSNIELENFRLLMSVKVPKSSGRAAVQFRSSTARGYSSFIGTGDWGKFSEQRQGFLVNRSCDSFIKAGDWNLFEIVSVGSRTRTAINGNLCVNLVDDYGPRKGYIGFEMDPKGRPVELRIKNLRVESEPGFGLVTLKRFKTSCGDL